MGVCVGCGLYINPDTGLLEVEIDSGLSCSDAGLKVEFPASQTGSSTWNSSTGQVIVSPDNGNGITPAHGNGLYAPCPDSIVGIMNPGGVFGGAVPIPVSAPNVYNLFSVCGATATSDCVPGPGGTSHLRITNTLYCAIEGLLDVQVYGGKFNGATANFDAELSLLVNINMSGLGWSVSTPPQMAKMNNGATEYSVTNMTEKNWVSSMPPGGTVTYSACASLAVIAGSATWAIEPNFEYHWHFTQTGCC